MRLLLNLKYINKKIVIIQNYLKVIKIKYKISIKLNIKIIFPKLIA